MKWSLLLACAALPLAAQQPRMGDDEHSTSRMMSHMQEMMAPMMGAMAFKPDQLLARKDTLGLTPHQITSLTDLADAAKKAHEQCGAGAKPHLDAIAQQLRSGADTAALHQHFEAAHAAMGQGHWAMFTIALRARAVLTEQQRTRVERWASHEGKHREEHH